MSKLPLILVLLASLAASACATGVQSPVVRFERQVAYHAENLAQPSSVVDFRQEMNARSQ
ncbi:MAG: hypothetical protein IPH39_06060 [Sulfuritalea sp.]|jgi:hypothetical protein|nr:hypothetical protein [Sulfuritalea sp.]MBK8761130.1 hypothetical protein [Sulfuritalea sp.]